MTRILALSKVLTRWFSTLTRSHPNHGQASLKGGNGKESRVHLGTPENIEGFGLAVDIKVEGVDEELLNAGLEVCLDS